VGKATQGLFNLLHLLEFEGFVSSVGFCCLYPEIRGLLQYNLCLWLSYKFCVQHCGVLFSCLHWFDDACILKVCAGHCQVVGRGDIVSFHVPIEESSCTVVEDITLHFEGNV